MSAWIVFPALLCIFSLPLGIALREWSGKQFNFALTLPLGFAVLVVYFQLITYWKVSTPFALPILGITELLGIYFFRNRFISILNAINPYAWVAGITYVVYSLPIWMTGTPTFAGWIKLDDGSSWLAFADRLIESGRNTFGLLPSSYEAVLQINLTTSGTLGPGYPVGAFVPLGGISKVLNVDPAWSIQPYMSFLAALLAIIFFVAIKKFYPTTMFAGVAAVTSSCAALFYGYAMWGGVKELAMAPLIALTMLIATSTNIAKNQNNRLSLLPFAVSASAVIGVAGLAGGIWIIVPTIYLVVKLFQTSQFSFYKYQVLIFMIGAAVFTLPILLISNIFSLKILLSFTAGSKDIGNLVGPLNRKEILGIWPNGDFRFSSLKFSGPLNLVLAIVAILVVLGVYSSWKKKNSFIYLMAGSAFLFSMIFSFGNAWIAGKCFAISSPFILLSALTGISWLLENKRVVEAAVSNILVIGGVIISLTLIYHDVWIAPYSQLKELQLIGQDHQLASPALILEYNPYADRHFLRKLNPEGAGELRRHLIPLLNGSSLAKGAYADIDDFQLNAVEAYNTLVLRKSPIASRPPSNYKLLYSLNTYEVWEKDQTASNVMKHVSYGNTSQPSSSPTCKELSSFAAKVSSGNSISTVLRSPMITLPLNSGDLPPHWISGSTPGSVDPIGNGSKTLHVTIQKTAQYLLWLGGSYRGNVGISVDGNKRFNSHGQINHANAFTEFGSIHLEKGSHVIEFHYNSSVFAPGTGGASFDLGPIVLSESSADLPVLTIDPAHIKSLCGKQLDWIEEVK